MDAPKDGALPEHREAVLMEAGAVPSMVSVPKEVTEEKGKDSMGFASHEGTWVHTLEDDGKTPKTYYWSCCGPRHPESYKKDSECPVAKAKMEEARKLLEESQSNAEEGTE